MDFGRILDGIEQYLKIKQELKTAPANPCTDWDCGLANEFSVSYDSSEQRARLEETRVAVEKALNEYVDSRIREVAKKGN
ncbi:MAG: hypothetical protein WCA08_13805 [Desulfoferrobacter sp.]